ncbi:MAG TPA: hypothetical protein VKU80_14190 [Planctomycetota bacterium]|nr:hypothetical protein [Planctomycetota bacterium]
MASMVLGLLLALQAERQEVRKDLYGDPLPKGAIARLGTTRLCQPEGIVSLSFSPDGKTLASGGGALRLWDLETGRRLRKIERFLLNTVVFSPDGQLVAGGWSEGEIGLWDARSGDLRHEFKAHRNASGVPSIVFSSDGSRLVSCEEGDTVRFWDPSTGKEVMNLEGLEKEVRFVALSRDGQALACVKGKDRISIWDVKERERLHEMTVGREAVNDLVVAFSPDGKTLASWCLGRKVVLWDVSTGLETRSFDIGSKGFSRCAVYTCHDLKNLSFSPDGTKLAFGGCDCAVHVWDVAAGKELLDIRGHYGQINAIAYSPDGTTVASGDEDGVIRLWRGGERQLPADVHQADITALVWNSTKNKLFTGGGDPGIRVWEPASGRQLLHFPGQDSEFGAIALSADGSRLATETSSQSVALWDVSTAKELHRWEASAGRLRFSLDGRFLVGMDSNGELHVWDTISGAQRFSVRAAAERGNRWADFLSDGLTLAWSTDTGISYLPVMANGSIGEKTRPLAARCIESSSDGRLLAVESKEVFKISVLDLLSGDILFTFKSHQTPVEQATFSPNGKLLAWVCRADLHVADLSTGLELIQIKSPEGPSGRFGPVCFSPDGVALATALGQSVLIWELPSIAPGEPKDTPDQQWDALARTEAVAAYKAIWSLIARGNKTVSFLKDKLSSPGSFPRLSEGLDKAINDLDSDDTAVRDKASSALKKQGISVIPRLKSALERSESAETRGRIADILSYFRDPFCIPEDGLQLRRAVHILEVIGTKESGEVLKELQDGRLGFEVPDALPALERLRLR